MIEAFCSFIKEQNLLPNTFSSTLLAVSGGVDSVVMCALFKQAQWNFAIAHCNFNLRGMDSTQDAWFVKNLAKHYHVPFYYKACDIHAHIQEKKISTQMAARELRYQWFYTLLDQHRLGQVATAHHWNDNIETILLNLAKGAGITELHGIRTKQNRLIRPLLFSNKEMIIQYAKKHHLSWREDTSNAATYYQRNFIRNVIIPSFKVINPNLEETFKRTSNKLCQTEAILQEHVAHVKSHIFLKDTIGYRITVQTIAQKSWAPLVLFEILRPFGFNFLQISNCIKNTHLSGKQIFATDYKISIDRNYWLLTSINTSKKYNSYIITEKEKFLSISQGSLKFKIIPKTINYIICNKSTSAALDWSLLKFPLLVRKWQHGDFFYPLGMRHRKKISDFLIDLKVPRPLKEHIYVITTRGEIVWVIGYRIDDRFKIGPATQQIYTIQLEDTKQPLSPETA